MIIAIQKNGRLTQPSLDFVNDKITQPIVTKENTRHDYIRNNEDTVIFLKYGDILPAVINDIADCGIIGSDSITESSEDWDKLISLPLGFAKCRLALAVKNDSEIENTADLENKQIVTEFPLTTKKYLAEKKISPKIYKVKGSCEVFSYLNFADAIIDIVETGASLKAYDMKVIEYLMDIEAILIYKDQNKVKKMLSKI